MTGAMAGAIACLGRTQILGSVVVGTWFAGGDYYGYSFGSEFGSNGSCAGSPCTPPGVTTGTSFSVGSKASTYDFFIRCSNSSGTQTMFRGVRIQRHDGTFREYLTADATFFQGGIKEWRWGSGLNPGWTSDANTLTRSIEWLT